MTVRREGGGLQRLVVALKDLDGIQGKVGWFESAHYPDGPPVAYVATIHEFGAPAAGIPPRPFMRPAVAEFGASWIALMAQGTKAVLTGAYTASQVLEMVTLKAAGDVAKKIQAVTDPPLSQTTLIARHTGAFKGGKDVGAAADLLSQGPQNLRGVPTKPLVWTGQLIQSVTGKVEPA